MKNFNFALLLAIYIFAVGWFFVRIQQLEVVITFAMAASPLAIAAFYAGGFRFRQDLDRKQGNTLLAHFLALASSLFLIRFVILFVAPESSLEFAELGSQDSLPVFGYYWPLWPLIRAVEFLGINILLATSALTIWSSYCYSAGTRNAGGKAAATFFAGVSEPIRIIIYLYILTFTFSIGILLTAVLWKDFTTANMIVIIGRASVALVAILLVALFRLKIMGPGVIIAAAGTLYLVALNTTTMVGAVSVLGPLAVLGILFGIRWYLAGRGGRPVVAAAGESDAAGGGE